jgi:hypothetical protein
MNKPPGTEDRDDLDVVLLREHLGEIESCPDRAADSVPVVEQKRNVHARTHSPICRGPNTSSLTSSRTGNDRSKRRNYREHGFTASAVTPVWLGASAQSTGKERSFTDPQTFTPTHRPTKEDRWSSAQEGSFRAQTSRQRSGPEPPQTVTGASRTHGHWESILAHLLMKLILPSDDSQPGRFSK